MSNKFTILILFSIFHINVVTAQQYSSSPKIKYGYNDFGIYRCSDPEYLKIDRSPTASGFGQSNGVRCVNPNPCDFEASNRWDPERQWNGVNSDKINPSRAIKACEIAVSQFPNEIRYQYQLARSYYAAKNYSEALQWYERAAKNNYQVAQSALAGFFLSDNQGYDRDISRGSLWARKAAEQGHPGGQYLLGWMYERGVGVDRDINKAIEFYIKSDRQGYESASIALKNIEQRRIDNFTKPN